MAQYAANPRVSFAIVASENRVGPDDQRCLLIGQKTSGGSATAGSLVTDVPRTDAEINALFGADSHLAMIARAYRAINDVTNVDALPLADHGSGTAATSSLAFTGTATASGTYYVTVISDELHTYKIDVLTGDTAATVATAIKAAIDADRYLPFTNSRSTGTLTLTAANKGTHANTWLLALKGSVPGLSCTLTGWANGATDPSLTTLFDPIETLRYQSIIWPEAYDLTKVKNFLNARKNVDNQIMDGTAYTYRSVAFGTVKTLASDTNSSEVVVFSNEPTAVTGRWVGPHLPEASDVLTAKAVAAFDLRVEPDVGISSVVVTNAANDQFGGIHTNSLPMFNTPLIGVGQPLKGTGYTMAEQAELEANGVSVLAANRAWNGDITSVVVTTWLNDAAGNPDNTWKYLEWRKTHGAIREYFQRNCQKKFRQSRLTSGIAVAGYDITDEAAIRAFCKQLYIELALVTLTVAGQPARVFFENNLTVQILPEKRQVKINSLVPMVSQLGVITGALEYTFSTN